MPATAENILADFDATEFTLGDMHVAFRIGEDGYQAAVTERDGRTPGLARATALWLIAQAGDAQTADQVALLLGAPDPVVRAAAIDAQQRSIAPQQLVPRLAPLLDDPMRNMRIGAARLLLAVPRAALPAGMLAPLGHAFGEMQAALTARLDYPETHLQLSGIAQMLRKPLAAARAVATATEPDPQLVEAWVIQARIAGTMQGADAAGQFQDPSSGPKPERPFGRSCCPDQGAFAGLAITAGRFSPSRPRSRSYPCQS